MRNPRLYNIAGTALVAAASLWSADSACGQTRALGIDVSDWQNQTGTGLPIDWPRVARPVAQGGGGKQFAFIRSSRGGTSGPYHFGRADILSYVIGGNTVIHTGTDEANHMLEQAGAFMRPGYLRPVFDLEAGAAQRSRED